MLTLALTMWQRLEHNVSSGNQAARVKCEGMGMPGSKLGAAQAVAAVSNIVRLVPSESQGARKQICLDAIAVAAETITTEWPAAGKKAAHIVICIGGFDADGAAHNTYIVGACNAFEAVGLLAITQSDLITNP